MPRETRPDALEFAERLLKALDGNKLVPRGGQGRQDWIVDQLDALHPEGKIKGDKETAHVASMASVSKWLKGQSIPEGDNLLWLADLIGADPVWLKTGETGETFRPALISLERREQAAAAILGSYIRLAGGDYALVSDKDARAAHVNLRAILDGQSADIRVIVPGFVARNIHRLEAMRVPLGVVVVAAMQTDILAFDFLRVDAGALDRGVTLTKRGDSYEVGSKLVPVLLNFETLFGSFDGEQQAA